VTGREDSTINVVQDILTTVFVADLRGFTRLSETLTPRILTDIINAWCKRAQRVIDRYGGHVDKFIGDAVMASWSHKNEVNPTEEIQNALWAAVDLNKETKELSDKFSIELPFPLKMGVGINTGSVTVGNVGKDARRDFTMLGDTVNMAFRYETHTKTHGTDINIGDLTMKWLKGTENAFRKIEIELPGRSSKETIHGISTQELELHLMKTMTVF
jgi:adenylate cyclase